MTKSRWYSGNIDVERAVLEALSFVKLAHIYVNDLVDKHPTDLDTAYPHIAATKVGLDALDNDFNRILSGEQLNMDDFTSIVRVAKDNIGNDCAEVLAEAFFQDDKEGPRETK